MRLLVRVGDTRVATTRLATAVLPPPPTRRPPPGFWPAVASGKFRRARKVVADSTGLPPSCCARAAGSGPGPVSGN